MAGRISQAVAEALHDEASRKARFSQLVVQVLHASSPGITSLTPNSGSPGDTVTIDGTSFGDTQGSGSVTFTSGATATVTSWSATQIVVTVPVRTITGNVVVTRADGLFSDGVLFTLVWSDAAPAFRANLQSPGGAQDITPYLYSGRIHRGRQHELDRTQTGNATIVLDNQDRRFDPNYTLGPHYGTLKPINRIEFTATFQGVNYPLFAGYVEEWPGSWEQGVRPLSQVRVADGFKILAMFKLNTSYNSELSGMRINNVLSDVLWTGTAVWVLDSTIQSQLGTTTILAPAGLRRVDAGQTTLQAATLSNTPALTHIQDVTQTEDGLVFVAKDGTFTFYDRHYRNRYPFNTSQATFGDALGELNYSDLTISYSDSHIYNDVRMGRVGGTVQTASSTASQSDFFKRTLAEESLLSNSDAEMADRANTMLNRYKDPLWRVRTIMLKNLSTADWPTVMNLELGDRVTVKRRPQGGEIINRDYVIEAIDYEINGGFQWQVTLSLSPAFTVNVWTLAGADGDEFSASSQLGVSTALGY